MQIVALGWLVFQLTDSAFWVGVVAAASSVPAVIFSLFGGWIVDHFPKKSVLFYSNMGSMFLAFILGALTLSGHVNIPIIIIISFLGGVSNSVCTPAHFSYISEIVEPDKLTSAMALNSSISNLGRILGPIITGIYIKIGGIGGAFVINGLSYVAVLLALHLIKSSNQVTDHNINPLKAIREGIVYAYANPMIRSIITYVGFASIFAWSYTTIIPVLAKEIFSTDATGMSYLYGAVGIGAVTATFFAAFFSHLISKLALFIAGNSIFSISLLLFSFTSSLFLGTILLFFVGLGLVTVNIVLGTIVQHMTDPHYRGRVSSIYFLFYGGIIFLGNLEIGYLSDTFNPQMALRLNTIAMLAVGVYIFLTKNRLRQAQSEYNETLTHN